jgi:hypothetical protein
MFPDIRTVIGEEEEYCHAHRHDESRDKYPSVVIELLEHESESGDHHCRQNGQDPEVMQKADALPVLEIG